MKKVGISLDEHLWEFFRIACLKAHITASKQIGLLLVQFLHEQAADTQARTNAERAAPLGMTPRDGRQS